MKTMPRKKPPILPILPILLLSAILASAVAMRSARADGGCAIPEAIEIPWNPKTGVMSSGGIRGPVVSCQWKSLAGNGDHYSVAIFDTGNPKDKNPLFAQISAQELGRQSSVTAVPVRWDIGQCAYVSKKKSDLKVTLFHRPDGTLEHVDYEGRKAPLADGVIVYVKCE